MTMRPHRLRSAATAPSRSAPATVVLALCLAGSVARAAPSAGPPAESPPDKAPSAPAPRAAAGNVDLAKLRADYDRLRDQLFQARARAQLVEEGVFAAKLGARLRWKGAPDFILRRAELRVDGNSVWDSGEKPLVDEIIKVAERPIKPGTHAITVRLEVRPGKKSDKESAELGYASEQTFVVNVADHRRTTVEITADDDGDLPGYEPEVEIEIDSEKE
jgi:hypothetical protein